MSGYDVVMAASPTPRRRTRGSVTPVASGGFRVRVYAGYDSVSKKPLYLDETVPAGPGAAKEAERLRTRLLAEVDERRNPRTRATVNQMLDKYLTVLDIEPTTRSTYEGYIANHIRPVLGELPLARLEPGDDRQLLRPAPRLPHPLRWSRQGDRPPDSSRARLRRPMPTAPLQAARRRDRPPDRRHPQRRLRPRREVEVDQRQPGH